MGEKRKIDIVYSLVAKLNAIEKQSFKKFLHFYFKKPDVYLGLNKQIGIIHKSLKKDEKFPEDRLKKRFEKPKQFASYKHKFKQCLFSFLRHNYTDNPENNDVTEFSKEYLNGIILFQNQEQILAYENLQKTAVSLREKKFFPELLSIQYALQENAIPYYGFDAAETHFTRIHHEYLADINSLQELVTSRYLKLLIFLKKRTKNLNGIDEIFTQLETLKNETKNYSIEVDCLSGMAQYYTLKKDAESELKMRFEICDVIDQSDAKHSVTLHTQYMTYRVILELKEEYITKSECEEIYSKMKKVAAKLYDIELNKEVLNFKRDFMEIYFLALFGENPKDIDKTLNGFMRVEEAETIVFEMPHFKKYRENRLVCLFKANDFEKCHTESFLMNKNLSQISSYSILCNAFSSYFLFDLEYISLEFRNLTRFIKDNELEKLYYINDLLKILKKDKQNVSSKKGTENLKIEIREILERNTAAIKRMEKRLIDHFIDAIN